VSGEKTEQIFPPFSPQYGSPASRTTRRQSFIRILFSQQPSIQVQTLASEIALTFIVGVVAVDTPVINQWEINGKKQMAIHMPVNHIVGRMVGIFVQFFRQTLFVHARNYV